MRAEIRHPSGPPSSARFAQRSGSARRGEWEDRVGSPGRDRTDRAPGRGPCARCRSEATRPGRGPRGGAAHGDSGRWRRPAPPPEPPRARGARYRSRGRAAGCGVPPNGRTGGEGTYPPAPGTLRSLRRRRRSVRVPGPLSSSRRNELLTALRITKRTNGARHYAASSLLLRSRSPSRVYRAPERRRRCSGSSSCSRRKG